MKNHNLSLLTYVKAGLLLLSVLTLYAGSLHAPLDFDDLDFFENPEALLEFGHTYFSFDTRWLSYATFGWTLNWFGLDIFWLRLGNVLMHAANSIALFFLLRRLFQATLNHDDENAPALSALPLSGRIGTGLPVDGQSTPLPLAWLAFFGALIFALHPVASYGVAYLVERSILMATLFTLLMLFAYLEGILRGGRLWLLLAVVCYFAAVHSKEHSIAAPSMALALTFLIRKPSMALFRQIAPYFILTALIAATVLLNVKGVLGHAYEPNAKGMLGLAAKNQELMLPNVYLLSIITQSFLFFKYLWLWLLPNPAWMSVDMREPFAMSFLSWPHTLGLIAFLIYPCIAVWLLFKRGSAGLLGFALLFPWILFLTELSTVRIQEPFVLYRSYLWMPGLFAALPVTVGYRRKGGSVITAEWFASKRTLIFLGVACLSLIPLTLNRLNTFSTPLLLWDDAEKLVRNKQGVLGAERIYYNRGTLLGQLNRYEEAIADFDKVIAIFPRHELAYGNRATANYFLGKYEAALYDYNNAIALNANNANSYYGRALTYRALGNFAAAQNDFRESCKLGVCPKDE